MRFTEKIRKLTNGQTLTSFCRRVRLLFNHLVFPSPLSSERIIASIEGDKFREIYRRYAVENPGADWPKFLDLNRWIRVNMQHVRELRLNDGKRGRILDLGCGTGYFAYICRQLGHDAIGLDINEVPMFGELTQLLRVPRVIWRIQAFVPLPDFGHEFDLITAFLACFNNHAGPETWGIVEWDFFLDDVARHLSPGGRLWLELNRQADGQPYSPELKRFFESRGAEIDIYRVIFNSGPRVPSSRLPIIR
jgi:SAM-dependent methyltransferase